ncbi:MAG: hypothetical protein AABY06_02380 [Nanoarchaeota archaeon]
MVEVKIQKRISKQGKNEYFTYVVTIPKTIIDSVPELKKTDKFELTLEKGKIILNPKTN